MSQPDAGARGVKKRGTRIVRAAVLLCPDHRADGTFNDLTFSQDDACNAAHWGVDSKIGDNSIPLNMLMERASRGRSNECLPESLIDR